MDGGANPEHAQAIHDLMRTIALEPDMAKVRALADEFIRSVPPQQALGVAAALNFANPFYLPTMDDASASRLRIDLDQFCELVMRARLTASRARQPNILVACAPKSASTFIAGALSTALGIPHVSLATPTLSAYSGSVLGANLREQETDDMALLRNGLSGAGYVAQHHIRCTPFLARQIALYGIKPIVTVRNIFDTLVSLDDMLREWRQVEVPGNPVFFDDGMPAIFTGLDDEARFEMLTDATCVWYVKFLLTWQKCEAAGMIKPLWVSYEDDFVADKARLGARIAEFVGLEEADAERIATCFADTSKGTSLRLNKGVAGRGDKIPAKTRERIVAICRRYAGEGDLRPLLGKEFVA